MSSLHDGTSGGPRSRKTAEPSVSSADSATLSNSTSSASLAAHVVKDVSIAPLLAQCLRPIEGIHDEAHDVAPECLRAFNYVAEMPGKNVRSHLIDAFQAFFTKELTIQKTADLKKNIECVKEVTAMLHNASLLVDDIEDESVLRRGKPCAHKVFGIAQTLNAGNYVYFLALEKLKKLPNADLCENLVVKEILNLHRGQGREILWRDAMNCPSVEEYVEMILDKTGGLFRLAIGLLFLINAPSDLTIKNKYEKLVNLLAVYFQIRDDFINLANTKYFQQKSFCEDLSEGKFSFPVIHGIQVEAEQDKDTLLNILRQRPKPDDVELKLAAVDIMKTHTESFAYSRGYLDLIQKEIEAEIEKLGGHPKLSKLLARLEEEVNQCEI